ncbi:MAG: aminomethyl-transferring glycine dehydrogenase subunit GcvPB [Acidaminococcaceae bacterium]|jgi:glycine dehydrogenase subunit 2|nr:aminomethyl-transferring glycine dehydrogenase subunit GcvPB [Acidaminococcaceae bacterium]
MDRQPLLFELGKPGRRAVDLPVLDVPVKEGLIPENYCRQEKAPLPELSQIEVVRHYTQLSERTFGVDNGFYPLGSCTMKYNPVVNEAVARYPGLSSLHPLQPVEEVQGAMEIMYNLKGALQEITGMDGMTLEPAAGAHGELTGLKLIRAYHRDRNDLKRNKVIVPDSAHGTNPASTAMCGMEVVEIKSAADGSIDLEALKAAVGEDTAALMLTNPTTLGLFEHKIEAIAKIVHEAGGLLYYDGANSNAIMGVVRPGDMGYDVVHLNLHKTFSTPHGGGGPGSGPVGVKKALVPYLPNPQVVKTGDKYIWQDSPKSIGKVIGFNGNFGVMVRAYAYILAMGGTGLLRASEDAVLNANYIKKALEGTYDSPFADKFCMHECVLTSKLQHEYGVHTLDIAKRLLDYGYHPPTIYFPMIVEEAIMIEPTETESKETLDGFIQAMKDIAKEASINAEVIKTAPHTTIVGRMDETLAARKPVVKWGD